MDIIKNIINEEIDRFIINESLSSVVYHFTYIDSLKNILHSDSFILGSIIDRDEYLFNHDNNLKNYYLSFTRQKNGYLGYSKSKNVRITLDGEMLNYHYKSYPINYFYSYNKTKSDFNKSSEYNPNYDKFQKEVENEDRLFSDSNVISNAHKYIKRIDILCSDKNIEYCKWLLYNNKFNLDIKIYNDDKSFKLGNKNYINDLLIGLNTSYKLSDDEDLWNGSYSTWDSPDYDIYELIYSVASYISDENDKSDDKEYIINTCISLSRKYKLDKLKLFNTSNFIEYINELYSNHESYSMKIINRKLNDFMSTTKNYDTEAYSKLSKMINDSFKNGLRKYFQIRRSGF